MTLDLPGIFTVPIYYAYVPLGNLAPYSVTSSTHSTGKEPDFHLHCFVTSVYSGGFRGGKGGANAPPFGG